MDKIIDNLYLGDIQGASNLFMLKRMGITHILQVAAGFQPFFPGQFKYKVVNVLDMPYENIARHFSTCIEFILKALNQGGSVLVHCYAGISRSASVVIAYMMQELGMSLQNALLYTRQRRPIVYPNPGFQKQLFDFEKSLLKRKKSSKRDDTVSTQSPMKKKDTSQQQTDHITSNVKYASMSADKSKTAHKTVEMMIQEQVKDLAKYPPFLQQSQNVKQQEVTGQRLHTSQNPLRKSHQEALIKQELQNRANNSEIESVKQPRARSAYGAKSQVNKQRNNDYYNLHPSGQSSSIDPALHYYQQPSTQENYNRHKGISTPATNPQSSMYSSIQKQRQTSKQLMPTDLDKLEKMSAYKADVEDDRESFFFCGLCKISLFSSKDVINHSSGGNLVGFGGNSSSQRTKASLQSKFTVNSNQILGKTFSEMNQAINAKCGSLFIKRKDWVNEQDGSQGNIMCPRKNCAVKIGSYCWQGSRCSTCQQFVAPSFQIFRNRVFSTKYSESQSSLNAQVLKIESSGFSMKDQKKQLTASPKQKQSKQGINLDLNLNFTYGVEAQARKQKSGIEALLYNNGKARSTASQHDLKGHNSSKNKSQRNKTQNEPHQQHKKSNTQLVNSGFSKGSINNLYQQLMVEQAKQQQFLQALNQRSSPMKQSQQR